MTRCALASLLLAGAVVGMTLLPETLLPSVTSSFATLSVSPSVTRVFQACRMSDSILMDVTLELPDAPATAFSTTALSKRRFAGASASAGVGAAGGAGAGATASASVGADDDDDDIYGTAASALALPGSAATKRARVSQVAPPFPSSSAGTGMEGRVAVRCVVELWTCHTVLDVGYFNIVCLNYPVLVELLKPSERHCA
jgi:hypothetical protein